MNARSLASLGLGALVVSVLAGAHVPDRLPAIVFVSRLPLAERGAIPGLGPHHRAAAPGGRLMLREPDGAIRPLLADGAFHDVADPAVSPDARRVAFASVVRPGERWRLWLLDLDGHRVTPVTAGAAGDFDDLDPCWVTERLLCFSSTRLAMRSQYAGVPVTNLWLVGDEGFEPRRITTERNGADEPSFDPERGELLYSRWWFNPWRSARGESLGVGIDAPRGDDRDSVNVWQLVSIAPDRLGPRLAAGAAFPRRDACAYGATAGRRGEVVVTYAANLGLSPAPGVTGVHALSRAGAPARAMLGAIVPASGADPYRSATGLAAPSACAPAALGDGGVLVSWDPGARGDFGLWLLRGTAPPQRVVDLPGTLELDAAPILARAAGRAHAWAGVRGFGPEAGQALLDGAIESAALGTFDFECLDVFGGAGGAPPRTPGARLRFFAAIPDTRGPAPDRLRLLREVEVGAHGEVRAAGLPAGVPLFEQLVDRGGATLRAAHGPAHVAGFNAGAPGQVTRCVGCHAGHSMLPVRTAAIGR